jgi:hypothetical protein
MDKALTLFDWIDPSQWIQRLILLLNQLIGFIFFFVPSGAA